MKRQRQLPTYAPPMRDIETIDCDLRLIAAVHRSIREHGGKPSSRQFDELLDERLAHRGGEERQPAALAAARRPGSISTYAVKEGGASGRLRVRIAGCYPNSAGRGHPELGLSPAGRGRPALISVSSWLRRLP